MRRTSGSARPWRQQKARRANAGLFGNSVAEATPQSIEFAGSHGGGALAEGRDLAIRGDICETRWEKDGEARSEPPTPCASPTASPPEPNRFGTKNQAWDERRELYAWRSAWERTCHDLRAAHGHSERVSVKAEWTHLADAARDATGSVGAAAELAAAAKMETAPWHHPTSTRSFAR